MDQKHSKMFWRQWEKVPILGRCSPHRLDDNAAIALQPESVSVILDQIEIQKAREAGSVYVGYQMWRRLQLDAIPRKAGLNERTRLLIEVMTINRLVTPSSEHAMPDWVRRTALADLLRTHWTILKPRSTRPVV
jgi:hypothetical protein